MPRIAEKERVVCAHFVWLVGTRNGVFYADGRTNTHNLGRHSLGTRDRQVALRDLKQLDLVKAVGLGLADSTLLKISHDAVLTLNDGQQKYLAHVSRPPVQGGATPSTVKRYRTVLAKFIAFAEKKGIHCWQQISKETLTRYGKWLDNENYHDKTQYTELTVLKQVIGWMIEDNLLPATSRVSLKLRKPQGTSTYCYSTAQVEAIVAHCRERPDLAWLADVVLVLSLTGLRISELASLRWSNLDLERGMLHLTDTSRQSRHSKRAEASTTKSHRDRDLPINPMLLPILRRLAHMPDGRVFHGPHGGKIKPDTVRNVLNREVLSQLSARFPATDGDRGIAAGRVHSFRHYFCSISADANVPVQMLMSWLGHRESEMIHHYYHSRSDEGQRQMAKIPGLDVAPKEG